MANRLILTLLALLTGLAAQIGPAEARAGGMTSVAVGMLATAPATKKPCAPVALARLPEPGLRNARAFSPACAPVPVALRFTTVATRIDRARE